MAEAERFHDRDGQADRIADMTKGVRAEIAATVAVFTGVGQETDARAIEDDNEDAIDRRRNNWNIHSVTSGNCLARDDFDAVARAETHDSHFDVFLRGLRVAHAA